MVFWKVSIEKKTLDKRVVEEDKRTAEACEAKEKQANKAQEAEERQAAEVAAGGKNNPNSS